MTDRVARRPTVADQPLDDRPGNDDADPALAERFTRGEPDAFEAVVERYHARVHRLAYRLLGWSGDADDVVQEVLLAALANATRFRRQADLGTWLTTITLNKCRTHRRGIVARLRTLAGWGASRPERTAPAADAQPSTDDTFDRVRSALQQLRPREREVIVLHYLEETPVDQMASLLGLTRGAVEVRLHRARAKLRAVLGVGEETDL
jgi:RNA polymerase sigma-70 factor (ECF subfamily)